jgi:hypothetical protein
MIRAKPEPVAEAVTKPRGGRPARYGSGAERQAAYRARRAVAAALATRATEGSADG